MSRRKPKSPFNAPSRRYEKYQENLKQADADETVIPSSIEEGGSDSPPTESPLSEDTIPSVSIPKKGLFSEFKKELSLIGTIVGIVIFIGSILLFFWDMNTSVNNTITGLTRVETKVEGLDKEWRVENQDIKISLAKILEKFERLFDIKKDPNKR